MNTPTGWAGNRFHIGGSYQHSENVAQPLDKIRPEFPAVVVFKEAQEAPMPDTPNLHIALYGNAVHMSRS